MRLPTPILRLMAYHSLSARVRLGPEDRACLEFATRLRVATVENRLRAVWTHPANELATKGLAAAIARALGLITGSPDYWFVWADGGGVIEFKSATGSLNPNQRDFRDWCRERGVRWALCRSADEAEGVLREWGALA